MGLRVQAHIWAQILRLSYQNDTNTKTLTPLSPSRVHRRRLCSPLTLPHRLSPYSAAAAVPRRRSRSRQE
uniref:Uncharacterized protein n=1 Tax=Leersia perrieri TaxID=77586 RepID=A0A0D9W4T6_9ORYZ